MLIQCYVWSVDSISCLWNALWNCMLDFIDSQSFHFMFDGASFHGQNWGVLP